MFYFSHWFYKVKNKWESHDDPANGIREILFLVNFFRFDYSLFFNVCHFNFFWFCRGISTTRFHVFLYLQQKTDWRMSSFHCFCAFAFFMEAESCCLCSWLMQKSKDKQRETERETTTHWHNIIHLYLKNGKKTRNMLTIQTWINLIKYINNINIKINMLILDNFFK